MIQLQPEFLKKNGKREFAVLPYDQSYSATRRTWWSRSAAIPGCISQGKTEDEAMADIRQAIHACLAARAANGLPLTVTVREVEATI